MILAIPPELEAKILRYFHVEKWPVGTIAQQLNVHHATVDRVLSQAGLPKAERAHRVSLIDAYVPFLLNTLERFPTLTASRLYQMVRERGYAGGPDHFRHLVAHYRPRPQPEAYLRLRTLPGEQAQVDWAHFGKIRIGRAERTLMAFVMVLSFSRQIFLRFFLDARMSNFLRGHEARLSQPTTRPLLPDRLPPGRTPTGPLYRPLQRAGRPPPPPLGPVPGHAPRATTLEAAPDPRPRVAPPRQGPTEGTAGPPGDRDERVRVPRRPPRPVAAAHPPRALRRGTW